MSHDIAGGGLEIGRSAFVSLGITPVLPSHSANPLQTVLRVLRSNDSAGRAAVLRSAAGIAAIPLDGVLSLFEGLLYARSPAPGLPVLFVCGPARSGTSITAQVIIRQFDVGYLSNIVEVFPRAPLLASSVFAGSTDRSNIRFSSFYGKSRGMREPSDAMAIWDRWLGRDRDTVPAALAPGQAESMRRFFGALESLWKRPIAAKYNRLYVCADLVAEALPTSHFVCLQRNALYLAQSQLLARRLIVGDEARPYGTITPEYLELAQPADAAGDACAYVAADRKIVARTRSKVGANRFWTVSYEQFCRDPDLLLERLSREVLGIPFRAVPAKLRQLISVSNRQLVDDATFATLEHACGRLGLSCRESGEYFV